MTEGLGIFWTGESLQEGSLPAEHCPKKGRLSSKSVRTCVGLAITIPARAVRAYASQDYLPSIGPVKGGQEKSIREAFESDSVV